MDIEQLEDNEAEIQKWVDTAKLTYESLDAQLKLHSEDLTFVMRTAFVTWLNEDEARLNRYINGPQDDRTNLTVEFVDECVVNDQIDDGCSKCGGGNDRPCDCK